MGQVTVKLNNRTYRLACGDGEEERLHALAAHVKVKVDALSLQFGQVGEDRLLLMAALLVADELFDARGKTVDVTEPGLPEAAHDPGPSVAKTDVSAAAPPPAKGLGTLAARKAARGT